MTRDIEPIEIEVRGLGAAEILVGETRITLSQERVFKTLFYLAVRAGDRVPRTDLMETLWSGEAVARGRQSLRQMLYRLRQMGLHLDESGEEVYLDPTRLRCDVREALADTWVASASAEAVWAAAELLPGFWSRTTPGFEDWLEGIRSRIASQFRRAALRHVAAARRSGRWQEVEELALRVLYNDPLNEEATLARAEALAMQGSKAMALDLLDAYVKELGERNDRIGLPAALLRKRISATSTGSQTHITQDGSSLLEREDCISDLYPLSAQHDEADGTLCVLCGPGGVGKTRLAHEITSLASLNGLVVIECRADSSEAYASHTLFRRFAQELLDASGAAGAAPDALTSLGQITSSASLGAGDNTHEHAAALAQTVTWCATEVLSSVAEEQRTLVLIEDVHNADVASLSIIGSLIARTQRSRVRWLFTSRHDDASVRRALSHTTSIHVNTLSVRPLSALPAASLARQVAEAFGFSLSIEDAARIARHTGGNPLFIHILGATGFAPSRAAPLPQTLEQLIRERLAQLNDASTDVVHGLVLLGPLATARRLRGATGLSHEVFSKALVALEHEGIVTVTPEGQITLHDCWRDIVDERFVGAARTAASLAYAEFLKNSEPSPSLTTSWHTARLFRGAGENKMALSDFTQVAQWLFARGLIAGAAEAHQAALECSTDLQDRRSALLGITLCHVASGNMESAFSTANTALASQCEGTTLSVDSRLRLSALRLDTAWRLGLDHQALLTDLVSGLSDSRASADTIGYASFTCLRVHFNDHTTGSGLQLALQALKAAEVADKSEFALLARLVFAAERGSPEHILDLDARLGKLSRDGVSSYLQALSHRYRAQALRWGGFYEDALKLTEQCFRLTTSLGLRDELALLALQSGFLCLDLNRPEDSKRWHDTCRDMSGDNPSHERRIATAQLAARIAVQEERFEDAASVLRPLIQDIRGDKLAKRRCAGAATLALALSKRSDHYIADEMITASLDVLTSQAPSLQLDFPCEATARALENIGNPQDAQKLLEDYATRRSLAFPRPVPPALTALAGAYTGATTRLSPARPPLPAEPSL